MPKSDIVSGSEFSPVVIHLPILLNMVAECRPKRRKLQAVIDDYFFRSKGKNNDARKTLGGNTILSMKKYGLIDIHATEIVEFTDFGHNLYAERADESKLAEMMGRQVLVNLNGLRVVSCIQDMIQAGEQLKKTTIATRLRQEGFHVPENGKHLNIMR